ncbi:MAG: Glu-tRNA(Gln) amidotransferase subunit GatD [Candidatus Altiarchaeota archaeon]
MPPKPAPGDRVEVKTKGNSYVGILMPKTPLLESGRMTLKLDSGYNIGIKEDDIVTVTLISKLEGSKPKKEVTPRHDSSKRTVAILSTGGTISSKIDYRTGGVYASYTAADLLETMPELESLANLKTRSLMNVMSEDMNPSLWLQMASEIAKELNSGADGVVVTHGTDTMHFSTAAMSFLLPNIQKPVVFTGSQRSSDRGSADSFLNLICSTAVASSDAAGVFLVMHGSISDEFCYAHLGTKVRKMHTSRRDAFRSINAEPVAKVLPDGKIEPLGDVRKRGDGKVQTDLKFDDRVALVKAYPGVDPAIIDFYVDRKYNGIVLEGTALGHVPTEGRGSLLPGLKKALDRGIAIAMTTQCLYGRVHPHVYTNLRKLSSMGVIYCEDMLPETAYVKLGWVLGHSKDHDMVKDMMLTSYSGEITERSEPDAKVGL